MSDTRSTQLQYVRKMRAVLIEIAEAGLDPEDIYLQAWQFANYTDEELVEITRNDDWRGADDD